MDRTDAKTKCESLMQQSKFLIREMKTDYWLRNNTTKCGGLIVKYQDMWQQMFMIVTVLLNLIILASYTEKYGDRDDRPKLFGITVNNTKIIMDALGAIALLFWAFIFFPTVVTSVSLVFFRFELDSKAAMDKIVKESNSLREIIRKQLIYYINRTPKIVYMLLSEYMVIYLILCVVFIILGLVWSPTYYAFLITYVIVLSPQMNSLLKAIWEPRLAIFTTLLLMVIIMYMLVVIAYRFFDSYYTDGACYSLWSCFVISLDQTLKQQGLGNYLDTAYSFTGNRVDIKYGRVIYDNIEFVLITLLLIAIISGIIIDKFGELRLRREEYLADCTSSCFICGKTRKQLDQELNNTDFYYHYKFQHNLWDYVYFIANVLQLKESNVENITYVENYVLDKISKNENTWFPCYQNDPNP